MNAVLKPLSPNRKSPVIPKVTTCRNVKNDTVERKDDASAAANCEGRGRKLAAAASASAMTITIRAKSRTLSIHDIIVTLCRKLYYNKLYITYVCYDWNMTNHTDAILTVNSGSSSLKVVVFGIHGGSPGMSRLIDISMSSIGGSSSVLRMAQQTVSVQPEEMHIPDHAAASRIIMEKLVSIVPANTTIVAVGHRLVHSGPLYNEPVAITDIAEADWELLSSLDPEHTPAVHELVKQFAHYYPSVPHIACFDTAFFNDLPGVAKIIPLPRKYREMGLHRYGFHGLAYTSLLNTFRQEAGETAAHGRIILAHLGSGASLAAVRSGKPIDTTMGFTPASGIVMSTRCGDLDPNVFGFLHKQTGITAEEFHRVVGFESGLLGVSGVSGDMQALLAREDENKDAALAIELFVQGVKKSVGAFAAALGGIDSLIFSGGIGEQSAVLRSRICAGLEYMGIHIDETANKQHRFLISAEQSQAGVHVIPADEARVIAEQTIKRLKLRGV